MPKLHKLMIDVLLLPVLSFLKIWEKLLSVNGSIGQLMCFPKFNHLTKLWQTIIVYTNEQLIEFR